MSFPNVTLLRLDALASPAPGNKDFKLRPFLTLASARGVRRLVSFGGAWSNHLHALAAVGAQHGLHTVGIVRAQPHEPDTPTLADARAAGMQLLKVGREQYAQRHTPAYLHEIEQRFAPCIVIPEGGATAAAAAACAAIGAAIVQHVPDVRQVVVAVGTGTTLAGIVQGLSQPGAAGHPARELCSGQAAAGDTLCAPQHQRSHPAAQGHDNAVHVHGIAALKGADDLDATVERLLLACGVNRPVRWTLHHEFHGGGFARLNPSLREFMLAFEARHGIPLDPVYTAKALYATGQLLRGGELDSAKKTVVVHTGGLQGRRGYAFLQ